MYEPELEEEERNAGLYVNVPGIPRPQPRPRMIPCGGGKLRVVGTANKHATLWKDAVQKALGEAAARVGWKGAPDAEYELVIVFRVEGAARAKPDLDNLVKLVMDAMQDAGVFGKGNDPDAQVTSIKARKITAAGSVKPGATAHLMRASGCELVLDDLSGLS